MVGAHFGVGRKETGYGLSGGFRSSPGSQYGPFPFFGLDPAWAAILLCGLPILLEAVIGLVTAFDIKADVLVSIALVASVLIGEDFAAGEVAFIMQLGALLEDVTVARARAGIERLVHLTPRTARRLKGGNGNGHSRGTGERGGCAAGAAGGDDPCGRRDPCGADVGGSVGNDRRVSAGG